jgi:hypothetical protein
MGAGLRDLEDRVWLRRELLQAGYNDKTIQRNLKEGRWHRVRHGAYCDAALWQELSAEDRHRLTARAVLRTSHPSTVLSHVSAALEHGVPVWGISLDEVHVTRTDGKPRRREAGVVHHCGKVDAEKETVVVNGVPVTVPLRVALEVTTIASVEAALVSVDALLRVVEATPEQLLAARAQVRHWPGSLPCEVVLRLAEPLHESALETRAAHMMRTHGVPRPRPQVEIRDETGEVVAVVDFAWVELGVFLEADGKAKYRIHRREGESLEDYLMREKDREVLICQLTGWTCIRMSWADLARGKVTAARIKRILDSKQVAA